MARNRDLGFISRFSIARYRPRQYKLLSFVFTCLAGCFWSTATYSAVCSDSIQGKIAWDYEGTNIWGAETIARLCGDAADSSEPARCFESVLHGRLPKAPGDSASEWRWQDAVHLCKGTRNSAETIACFSEIVSNGAAVADGMKQCSGRQFDPPPNDGGAPPSSSSQVVTLQLTPADANTSYAVSGRTSPGPVPVFQRIGDIRLTNLNGWYDALPDTRNGDNVTICQRACQDTDRCVAFVTYTAGFGSREFCGLIFDTAAVRYDKAWVSNSRGYTTFMKGDKPLVLEWVNQLPTGTIKLGDTTSISKSGGNSAVTKDRGNVGSSVYDLPMVGLRTVSLASVFREDTGNPFLPPTLWQEKLLASGADAVAKCATKCIEDVECYNFIAKVDGSGHCAGFKEQTTNLPVPMRTVPGFQRGTTYLGRVWRVDQNPLRSDRQRLTTIFKPQVGLGLFSDEAIRQIGRLNRGYADELSKHSALMHTEADRIWSGEEPPIASRMPLSEGESELDSLDMGEFLNAEFNAGFLPFNSTVWKSKTERDTYYYAPRAYWFDWDSDSQRLGGDEFFNEVGAIGDGEDVRMQIRLSGAYTPKELDTFKKYVNAFVVSLGLPNVRKFVRFPVSGSPTADLGRALAGLVGSESVDLYTTNMDGIGSPIDLVFNVSDINAQGLLTSWMDPAQTVAGDLVFQSSAISQDEIRIPVTLDPYNPGTYGNVEIVDGEWVNQTPFPVRITKVKALQIKPDRAESYYWDTESSVSLEPGGTATVRYDANFPEQLVRRMDRVWLQYEIDRDCETCAQGLFGVGAVTGEARSVVEFVLPDSVSTRHTAEEVEVYFRSRHLDPDDDRIQNARVIVLTPAEPSKSSPPLFLGDDNQLGFGVDSFTYRAILYTTDGVRLCTPWIDSGEQRVRLTGFSSDETDCE